MSQPVKKCATESIEESYNRHMPIAAKIQADFDKALKEIFADMSPECLEPFAAILLEHENTVMNKETLIERISSKMGQVLPQINESFFVANDVGKKLITLEVLKEKFEPYKGTSWNVHKLTPEERTRPVRMRLMDSSIRFIEHQLKSQEKKIEEAMAKTKANRELIQNIQNDRVKLYALMQQQSSFYKEIKPKLLDQHKKLIEKEEEELK
ncbi:uncharacterized protein LOC117569176 [Drosophila albomicans]|uniref:Uncharacterized protein LOC117569176 n=1 Tax=Drosophila albomicans TaxID=7291 RepID=A0A6P8WQV6_DROAB|nr:uncharacterized protein LOC117569176 [Drosophila albomicans]